MQKEAEKFDKSNIMEGMVSVRAVITAMQAGISDRRIDTVFLSTERVEKKKKEYAWLCHRGEELHFSVEVTGAARIEEMCIGNTHGGIIACCSDRTLPLLSKENVPAEGFAVMLEGIEDPYNFGYALRSLYAAGVALVVLSPRNWMHAAGVVCRASAGASELLPLYLSASGEDAVAILRQAGYKIICADLPDSVSMYDADLKKPLFLIVGGEKRGISRKILDMSDAVIRLDYARDFDGALSAASAASIIGYEVYRQNR